MVAKRRQYKVDDESTKLMSLLVQSNEDLSHFILLKIFIKIFLKIFFFKFSSSDTPFVRLPPTSVPPVSVTLESKERNGVFRRISTF